MKIDKDKTPKTKISFFGKSDEKEGNEIRFYLSYY